MPIALGLCVFLGVSLAPQIACADTAAAVVAKYDRDSDQTLDLAEMNTAASARFERFNKDADTSLDMREVKGVIGVKAFAAADTDHDGTLDAKELKSKAGRTLKRLID
jgi:Ca2+-binding EF-hand superfamily protein